MVLLEARGKVCDVGVAGTSFFQMLSLTIYFKIVQLPLVDQHIFNQLIFYLFTGIANDANFKKIKWALQTAVHSSNTYYQQHAVRGGGRKVGI